MSKRFVHFISRCYTYDDIFHVIYFMAIIFPCSFHGDFINFNNRGAMCSA